MLKATIKKGEASVVEAAGSVQEILADIMVLVNSIHTQFSNADPETAKAFRTGLTGMVNAPGSQLWKPLDGQTGIIFPKQEG